MNLDALIADLPRKQGVIHTFFGGKVAQYSRDRLAADVADVREKLAGWGVGQRMRVAIYAPNSYEWLVHDLALIELRAVSVPLTADFAKTITGDLLERYNIALLLISKRDAGLFPERPGHVAFLDAANGAVRAIARNPSGDPDEDDQLTLVFSSGSAGGLKGLVVSRKGVEETMPPIYEAIGVTPKDRLLLFLPMSNFQQRAMCYASLHYDFDLVITEYTELFAALRRLEPTLLVAPPIFYQMIHAQQVNSMGWKQGLLAGLLRLAPFAGLRRALARQMFREFHGQFGRNMRALLTGMAPIRRDIGELFNRMQLPLCESYGLMEAGSITYRPENSRAYGSVGKVLRGIRLEFEDDGEIIVKRDHNLTLRYFQCAEGENERTFVGPNRIATGDIGKLDADGNLYLLGRKKELIVTPGGQKVHPETIEHELNNCAGVANSVVLQRPGATHLTCVVELSQPEQPGARNSITRFANQLASAKAVAQHVEVLFADAPFSTANGMLRPNMKVDRKRIAAQYGI